jgi:hypothetical protein
LRVKRCQAKILEDHANSFTTQCLLIKHAFNRVHGFFVRVISTRGELAILDSPDRVSERFQRWVGLVPEPTVEATLGYNWRTPSAYLQTEPVPDPERSRNGYPRCPSCRSFSQYGLSLGPTLSALNSFSRVPQGSRTLQPWAEFSERLRRIFKLNQYPGSR